MPAPRFPYRVERRLRRPRRRAAPRGHRRRRPLVRRRAVLRVPPAQRLRRRRARRARRRPPPPDVRHRPPGPERGRRRRCGAGPSTWRPARSARSSSTTGPRSSRGSTSGSVAARHRYGYGGVAVDGRRRSASTAAGCSSTTSRPGTHRDRTTSARAGPPARACSCRPRPTPPRTTAWVMSFVYDATDGPQRPGHPGRPGPGRRAGGDGPPAGSACRSASTATGSPPASSARGPTLAVDAPHDLRRHPRAVPLRRPLVPRARGGAAPRAVGAGRHRRSRAVRAAGAGGFLGMEVPEKYGGGGVRDFRFNMVLPRRSSGPASTPPGSG